MEKRKKRLKPKCDNCGILDDVERYENILHGVWLCDDCADLPIKQIRKRVVEWVKVKGEYFPPDFPIAQRESQ